MFPSLKMEISKSKDTDVLSNFSSTWDEIKNKKTNECVSLLFFDFRKKSDAFAVQNVYSITADFLSFSTNRV